MPRPPRADEAGGLYHALNRGNARTTIFRKDADYEACVPVSREIEAPGIDCRTLPGGRAVTTVHQGPYTALGESYQRITDYVKEKGLSVLIPSREIYIKGPGMLLKGNEQKYLTEIQFMIKE